MHLFNFWQKIGEIARPTVPYFPWLTSFPNFSAIPRHFDDPVWIRGPFPDFPGSVANWQTKIRLNRVAVSCAGTCTQLNKAHNGNNTPWSQSESDINKHIIHQNTPPFKLCYSSTNSDDFWYSEWRDLATDCTYIYFWFMCQ